MADPSATADLACRKLVELVTEYLEDVLDDAERARFEGHLAGCRGCRAHLDQVRRTIRLTRSLAGGRASPTAAGPGLPPDAVAELRLLFRRLSDGDA